MNFEQFEEVLERSESQQAPRCYPGDTRHFDLWRASELDIQRVERELNVILPGKYKEFMLKYGGGQFLFLDLLPVVSPDGRAEDLIEVNSGAFQGVGFLAVSPVGTGDWWGFFADSHVCREQVDFRRHEDGYSERAADDFLDFLVKNALRPD
jgi:antitoxin YobK